jgi:hypothetical protein
MFSKWAFILVGNDKTGKTSFQKFLIEALCNIELDRLDCDKISYIAHSCAPEKLKTIFTISRSYQERRHVYKSVEDYFKLFFQDADICILSSHSHDDSILDIEKMMHELKTKNYNVAGVFWSNCFNEDERKISALPWQERLWIKNPHIDMKQNKEKTKEEIEAEIKEQIKKQAYAFADILIARAHTQ